MLFGSRLPSTLKGFAIQTFCEVVGSLFFGVNFQHTDIAVVDVPPNELPLDKKILRPIGDALFGGEEKSAVVILEDAITDGRLN
jgi:hypothetical protein